MAGVFVTTTISVWVGALLAFQDQPSCAPGSDWLSSVTPVSVKEGQTIEGIAWNACILSLCLLAFTVLDAIILTTTAVVITVYFMTSAMDLWKKSRGNSTEFKLEEGDSEGSSQFELMDGGEGMDDQREEESKNKR